MAESEREIAFDCRFFQGDRPCIWHKQTGVLCTCEKYERVSQRILVIKLDAMGDVLRSTSLLPPLVKAHPGAAVTWITRKESVPLLAGNPYVSEILELGPETPIHLATRVFDRVINLDAGKISAALAASARSARKDGFVLDEQGIVRPTNAAARSWLEAGLFDDLKRKGTATYQDRMAAIIGLTGCQHEYVLELTKAEQDAARAHVLSLGLDPDRPIVGLNHGAGGRWPLKQWREEGYVALIKRLHRETDAQVLLLGGPPERERTERFKQAVPFKLADGGCDNPVRHFAALVDQCHLVVTGDTLAMHISLARRKRTVVLFGPTSAAEIELYGLGEKVVPDMSCLSCYKTACDFVPNCMDLISVDMVWDAVARQLEIARTRIGSSSR
jgi:heptosyltransferase-2